MRALEAATELANKLTKKRRMYFTAVPCTNGNGWKVTGKFHLRRK